ncbi:SKP1-like protein 1B [Artemisia annua]|uniref:SKP1-like protein n=1 Tax=Artemisia annua TaxID=35608 RepID=A0A2U1MTH3_ARTAN|nr:SKP1-like protein 1B [Artemisia annua]
MFVLKSEEGESFEIDEKVAFQSQAIKHIIEDECDDNVIPIPFPSDIVSKVIDYCEKHAAYQPSSENDDGHKYLVEWKPFGEKEDKAAEELKAFDAEFAKVDTDMVQQILLAANFLDIKNLIDLMCHTIVDRIKGKTPEEIRTILNIKNDFTPEEEAALRTEHAWAFEGFE